jgi:hypothetical protein
MAVARMKLFDEYRHSLKMVEVEEILDLVFYRPLAFLFVKLIYSTNITPNQLTVFATLLGITAGVCLATAVPMLIIPAAVLLVAYIVIDCADGQLARMKRNGTRIGRILDGISDYVVETAIYLGLGIGLTIAGNNPVSTWILLVASAASNIVHAVLVDYYRNMFLDNVLQRVSLFDEDMEEFRQEYLRLNTMKGSYFQKLVLWAYFRYSSFQERLTARKTAAPLRRYDHDEYYRKNRLAVRLWTFVGTTTQMSFLVVCMLLGRFDIYFWGLIIAGNFFVVAVFTYQYRISKSLHPLSTI